LVLGIYIRFVIFADCRIIANMQQDITTRHYLPLSIGFAAGYRCGKHRLHISAEWYDKINRFGKYLAIEGADFIGQYGITFEKTKL
jgi:hypothetical protein